MRQKLKTRRPTVTRKLETLTDTYYVSFGIDLSDMTVREVFIRGSKIGSDMDILLDDASVVLSLALQYGLPMDQLLHSLHTDRVEGGVSIVARSIALMNEEIEAIKKEISDSRASALENVPAEEGATQEREEGVQET